MWRQLEAGEATDVVMPPRGQGMRLSLQPLSDFDSIPGAEDFIDEFRQPPHTVVNLGYGALLGLVNDVRQPGSIPGVLQRAVAMHPGGE